MDLSQLSDEELADGIEKRDFLLTVKYQFYKNLILDEIVDLYEEQLRRWSEKRKLKNTQAA